MFNYGSPQSNHSIYTKTTEVVLSQPYLLKKNMEEALYSRSTI